MRYEYLLKIQNLISLRIENLKERLDKVPIDWIIDNKISQFGNLDINKTNEELASLYNLQCVVTHAIKERITETSKYSILEVAKHSKLKAIKMYKELTGASLLESKQSIEEWLNEHN